MSVKNILAVALGILSAIGGFVDIGDLVFNTQADALTTLTMGVCSARNNTIDNVAICAWFKVLGSNSLSNVVVDTRDGTGLPVDVRVSDGSVGVRWSRGVRWSENPPDGVR